MATANPTLRPLSLGELLDRSFFLYRTHFLLFVGVVAIPHLGLLAVQLVGNTMRPKSMAAMGFSLLWSLLTLVVYLAVAAASQGGTILAVSKVHLGGQTTVMETMSNLRGRLVEISLIKIGLGIGLGIAFVLLIIPGIVLGLMWALAIPTAVLEDTGLGDSVSRSVALTKGSRLRILVIYILFLVLSYAIYLLWQIPIFAVLGIFTRASHTVTQMPMWTLIAFPLGTFLTESLVGPLLTIALTLTYYDQKVRKEAYDLQLMMSNLDATPAGAAVTPTPNITTPGIG